MGWFDSVKQSALTGALNAAGAVTNVAVPALKTVGHAVVGTAITGADAITFGQIDGLDEKADAHFDSMADTAENMLVGARTMIGANTPWYNGSGDPPPKDNSDWMARVPDDTLLNAMFIPGSHDTMASTGGDFVQTQVWSLEMQLTAGIRAFDMRIKHRDDDLLCFHGAFDLHAVYDDVVRILQEFVTAHPSETLVVSLSCSGCGPEGEHTQNYHEALQARWTVPELWTFVDAWPAIGDVRGKIVLCSRGRHCLNSVAPTSVQNNYKEADKDAFLRYVLDHATQDREEGVMYCNWMNSVGLDDDHVMNNVTKILDDDWAKSPACCAFLANKGLFMRIMDIKSSIFYIDYPGMGLIECIIERNFRKFREVNPPGDARSASSIGPGENLMMGWLDSETCWAAGENDEDPWYEIDLGEPTPIVGVVLQGRFDLNENEAQYIKSFRILIDGIEMAGGADGVFRGFYTAPSQCGDANRRRNVLFPEPVEGQVLRFCPVDWNSHASLRLGVLTEDE